MMTMTPDVIEKKWQHHDDLAVPVNDAAPWCRSTMNALTATQKDWIKNTEVRQLTGIFIGNLSAAFESADTEIMCSKLRQYVVLLQR